MSVATGNSKLFILRTHWSPSALIHSTPCFILFGGIGKNETARTKPCGRLVTPKTHLISPRPTSGELCSSLFRIWAGLAWKRISVALNLSMGYRVPYSSRQIHKCWRVFHMRVCHVNIFVTVLMARACEAMFLKHAKRKITEMLKYLTSFGVRSSSLEQRGLIFVCGGGVSGANLLIWVDTRCQLLDLNTPKVIIQ